MTIYSPLCEKHKNMALNYYYTLVYTPFISLRHYCPNKY